MDEKVDEIAYINSKLGKFLYFLKLKDAYLPVFEDVEGDKIIVSVVKYWSEVEEYLKANDGYRYTICHKVINE